MAKGKLIRIERSVNAYRKTKGLELEAPVNEVSIDMVPQEVLHTIVQANPDDPLLYDGYELNVDQLRMLEPYLAAPIQVDFENFEYFLEAYGVYD